MIIRTIILVCVSLFFCSHVLAQDQCGRNYRTCVRACNANRDQTVARNNIQRNQVRTRLRQELIQCNVQFVNDPLGRQTCRREKQATANAQLTSLDASDQQANRDRISCIRTCRTQLQECQSETLNQPSSGGFEVPCLEGGPPCRGEVSEFCQRAVGACDDCWRSLCGGGEWQIESEVPLSSATLVAARTSSGRGRILATSYTRAGQLRINVPRNVRLGSGERLYFQFNPRSRRGGQLKVTLNRR